MALNLSTLTNPATSGTVLAEALTTADFLDPVPILKNLSRGSNKGGDAKQTTALNQPRALPLIKNPSGNLGGYLYIPDVSGNYATGPSVTIGSNQTWQAEVDMVITQNVDYITPFGGGAWSSGFGLFIQLNGDIVVWSKGVNTATTAPGITFGTPFNLKYGYDGSSLYFDVDGVRKQTLAVSSASQSASITHPVQLNQQTLAPKGNYAIQKAKLTVNSAVVFDCDFNGSTSIRHGDTKFQASVGGPVSLTRAGQDPVTVVKKGVLRFDGVNDNLKGLLGSTVTEGYAFLAFSVLGGGGEQFATCFGLNSTGGSTISTDGYAITHRNSERLQSFNSNVALDHTGLFDDANGDILHEVKFKSGSQISKINNADQLSASATTTISSEEFSIAERVTNGLNTSFDLEYLALFPASITDAQADSVRNYINNRNNVFSLIDSQGYYFYNAQAAPVGAITTGSASWNGRIVGSDNGDTDKFATQGTTNEEPVGDGYVVTFADNADHLDIPQVTLAAGDSYAWMVCGTSLGTFSYKVTVSGETELNLLGHLGDATYRKAGDLYGIVLLPESATSADIEQARSLLIDRGAADGTSDGSITYYWRFRTDIVDFKAVDMSSATTVFRGWDGCSSMNSFGITQLSNCSNFTNAWQGTSALTSFPSGAKLGTEANNVNFQSAWRSSGLTSFSTPLPTATNLRSAFEDAVSLVSFNSQLPLATNALFAWDNCSSLTSFDVSLPSLTAMYRAWAGCSSLTDFSVDVFSNWNPQSISSGVFDFTWQGCTSLTAQSVENILTSIDASGKYATTTGASGGPALADAGIDITYNVATGSLSAATNAAVTSLKSKGWSIIVNNVTL